MICVYLGATGGAGYALGASSDGQFMAQLCNNIKKEAVHAIQKTPEILATSESFLKAVLRRYKITCESASKQMLLHARARMYYRMGRLLQQWPDHQATQLEACICM